MQNTWSESRSSPAITYEGGTPDVATHGCARGKDSPSGRSGTTTLFRSYACVVLPHSS